MSDDLNKQLCVYDEAFRLHEENSRLAAENEHLHRLYIGASQLSIESSKEVERLRGCRWVTYGKTESGDDLQPIIWGHEPTESEVDGIYRGLMPAEYDECGGVSHRTVAASVKA